MAPLTPEQQQFRAMSEAGPVLSAKNSYGTRDEVMAAPNVTRKLTGFERNESPGAPMSEDEMMFRTLMANKGKPASAPAQAAPAKAKGQSPADQKIAAAESNVEQAKIRGEAQAAAAEVKAEHAQDAAALMEKNNESIAKIDREWMAKADAEQANIERLVEEDSKRGIDPGRIYKDKDTLDQIAMFLGGFAGGMNQALTGSKTNSFIDTLDKLQSDDIAAQQAEIDRGVRSIKQHEGIYQRLVTLGHSRHDAAVADKVMKTETAIKWMEARAAEAMLPAEKANAEIAVNAMRTHVADLKQQVIDKAAAQRQAAISQAAASNQRAFDNMLKLRAVQAKEAAVAAKVNAKGKMDPGDKIQMYRLAKPALQTRALLDRINALRDKKTHELPGVGAAGRFHEALTTGSETVNAGINKIPIPGIRTLDSTEKQSLQLLRKVYQAYRLTQAGQNVTAKEEERIDRILSGKGTAEEVSNSLDEMSAAIDNELGGLESLGKDTFNEIKSGWMGSSSSESVGFVSDESGEAKRDDDDDDDEDAGG
jgi:hypothetical protein